jgi:hypothetical protein
MRSPWQFASQLPLVGKHSVRCIAIARDDYAAPAGERLEAFFRTRK